MCPIECPSLFDALDFLASFPSEAQPKMSGLVRQLNHQAVAKTECWLPAEPFRNGPNRVGAQQDQIPVIEDHLKRFRRMGCGKHPRRPDQLDD